MSQFAEEALAGLASTENFSKVALCKVDSVNRQGDFQPFADKMLLHVKGSFSRSVRFIFLNIVFACAE